MQSTMHHLTMHNALCTALLMLFWCTNCTWLDNALWRHKLRIGKCAPQCAMCLYNAHTLQQFMWLPALHWISCALQWLGGARMTYWECAETASDSLKCTEMMWSSLHCKMKFREMQTNVQISSKSSVKCKMKFSKIQTNVQIISKSSAKCKPMCK